MDIVLEALDYYMLDYAYAKVLPAKLSSHIPQSILKSLDIEGFGTFGSYLANNTNVQRLVSGVQSSSTFSQLFKQVEENDVYGYVPVWFETSIYTNASLLPRFSILRESISLFFILWLLGLVLYLGTATVSYHLVFDKAIFNHPRYLKNQMSLEIKQALGAIPIIALMTVPWFLLELNGYSKLYWNVDSVNGGWWSFALQYPAFIMFTDMCIYLAHRWLHWPKVYKALHKPHHKWLVTTPYASHAFHPVDGYIQSLPYHVYPFLFPLHKASYLLLFTFVSIWSVMIHDGEYVANDPYINGAACHTVHHLYFNYNYGQFTTLWDRIGFSYREPERELFDKSKKKSATTWNEQIARMEAIKEVVEGKDDDRIYGTEEKFSKKNN